MKQNINIGLFFIRLALAGVFIVHGVSKLANLEGTVSFFGMLGLPAVVAYLIAAVETLGGLAMLLGIGARTAGVALALVMAGAIYYVKFRKGFVGGWEFDLTLLLAALGIAFAGPGTWSVMKQCFPKSPMSQNTPNIPRPKQIA